MYRGSQKNKALFSWRWSMDIVGGLSRGNSEKGMRFCPELCNPFVLGQFDTTLALKVWTSGTSGTSGIKCNWLALGIYSKVVKPPRQDYDVTRTNIQHRLLTTYSR